VSNEGGWRVYVVCGCVGVGGGIAGFWGGQTSRCEICRLDAPTKVTHLS
jgi:hypothetical protein